MAQANGPLRFDHREVAVIFSLFIFVSLLMFTVGILVGKGLSQARNEGLWNPSRHPSALGNPETSQPISPTAEHESKPAQSATLEKTPLLEQKPTEPAESISHNTPAFVPIPQKPKSNAQSSQSLLEPSATMPSDQLLKNPKIAALVEEDRPNSKSRRPQSLSPTPQSSSQGNFTVQVGSYPTETEAQERVENLKKLGFPYAYFSVKQMGESKDAWFRVWLGYFPDQQSADLSGKFLKDRGEVKHYLVRKNEHN